MLELEVLIGEFLSVDRLAPGSISAGKVTALALYIVLRVGGVGLQGAL